MADVLAPASGSFSFDTGVHFSSSFDSGNLARVEQGDKATAFQLWTRPDCGEGPYRTWFHFEVSGVPAGTTLTMTVMNLNKQKGLYTHGYKPICKGASWARWEREVLPCSFVHVDGSFELTFKHDFSRGAVEGEPVRFAFCYPMAYEESQRRLAAHFPLCDPAAEGTEGRGEWRGDCFDVLGPPTVADADDVYYHREMLVRTLEGRRVDLITVTSHDGMLDEREAPLPGLEAAEGALQRSHRFEGGKRVVFVSARVHPGETPASFVFEGFLDMILQPAAKDPRAAELRRRFVFKFVPILNPDGVANGHYRADTLAVNLNRCYATPTLAEHPSVYAVRSVVEQHHNAGNLYVYLDMHAHASKRGVFLYGNRLDNLDNQVQNLLFARLVAVNSPFLDFDACNFSEKNMKAEDRKGGPETSKEGSGRVAVFRMTNINHSYTLECNYNEGKYFPGDGKDAGTGGTGGGDIGGGGKGSTRAGGLPSYVKYSPESWVNVGEACAMAILDLEGPKVNRWSLLPRSQYHDLDGARRALWNRLKNTCPAYRQQARTVPKKQSRSNGAGVGGDGGAAEGSSKVGRRRPSRRPHNPNNGGGGEAKESRGGKVLKESRAMGNNFIKGTEGGGHGQQGARAGVGRRGMAAGGGKGTAGGKSAGSGGGKRPPPAPGNRGMGGVRVTSGRAGRTQPPEPPPEEGGTRIPRPKHRVKGLVNYRHHHRPTSGVQAQGMATMVGPSAEVRQRHPRAQSSPTSVRAGAMRGGMPLLAGGPAPFLDSRPLGSSRIPRTSGGLPKRVQGWTGGGGAMPAKDQQRSRGTVLRVSGARSLTMPAAGGTGDGRSLSHDHLLPRELPA